VKECALDSDTMPDKYFQQATAKETQVWSRSSCLWNRVVSLEKQR